MVTAVVSVCAFLKVKAHKVEEQVKAQNGEIRQQGSKLDELAKEQSENFALLSKEIAVTQSQLKLLIGEHFQDKLQKTSQQNFLIVRSKARECLAIKNRCQFDVLIPVCGKHRQCHLIAGHKFEIPGCWGYH